MIKSEKSDEPLAEDESKHSFRLKPGLCNSSSTEGCFKGLKLKVHMQGMTHLLLHGTERVSGVSSGWIRQLQHFTDDSEILERCVQLLRVRCRFYWTPSAPLAAPTPRTLNPETLGQHWDQRPAQTWTCRALTDDLQMLLGVLQVSVC